MSQILTHIGQDAARATVAVNDLMALLRTRGRAALMLIFAFPNVLPAPPGLSGLLGLPLLYLSVQMMLGRMPWLPRFIGERAVPRDRFAALVDRLAPWLARAERLLRPRWPLLVGRLAEYVLGALCLILAAVLALPIPLGNMLPALAICLIALGILERDGVWVGAGIAIGMVALAVVAGVVYAVVKSAIFLLMNAFV
ncbi:MAG: exopolysaccharide biosynthesis protein [Rhodobacterales bacterium]|nr:exopolysaccharide biosynthesis protein [Rhodobacterales bacterium]